MRPVTGTTGSSVRHPRTARRGKSQDGEPGGHGHPGSVTGDPVGQQSETDSSQGPGMSSTHRRRLWGQPICCATPVRRALPRLGRQVATPLVLQRLHVVTSGSPSYRLGEGTLWLSLAGVPFGGLQIDFDGVAVAAVGRQPRSAGHPNRNDGGREGKMLSVRRSADRPDRLVDRHVAAGFARIEQGGGDVAATFPNVGHR